MKAEWQKGQYGFTYLKLGRFKVTVGWNKDGYAATFEGITLVDRFDTYEMAQQAGERLARKILKEALEALGE